MKFSLLYKSKLSRSKSEQPLVALTSHHFFKTSCNSWALNVVQVNYQWKPLKPNNAKCANRQHTTTTTKLQCD
jgi:hypothetical protein